MGEFKTKIMDGGPKKLAEKTLGFPDHRRTRLQAATRAVLPTSSSEIYKKNSKNLTAKIPRLIASPRQIPGRHGAGKSERGIYSHPSARGKSCKSTHPEKGDTRHMKVEGQHYTQQRKNGKLRVECSHTQHGATGDHRKKKRKYDFIIWERLSGGIRLPTSIF